MNAHANATRAIAPAVIRRVAFLRVVIRPEPPNVRDIIAASD
jgi:hypothetical protein